MSVLVRQMQRDAALVLWATHRFDTAAIASLTGLRESEVYNTIAEATTPRNGEESEGAA